MFACMVCTVTPNTYILRAQTHIFFDSQGAVGGGGSGSGGNSIGSGGDGTAGRTARSEWVVCAYVETHIHLCVPVVWLACAHSPPYLNLRAPHAYTETRTCTRTHACGQQYIAVCKNARTHVQRTRTRARNPTNDSSPIPARQRDGPTHRRTRATNTNTHLDHRRQRPKEHTHTHIMRVRADLRD